MSHKNMTNIFMCHLRFSQQWLWWLLQCITVVSARGHTIIDHKTVLFHAFIFIVYFVLLFQTYSLVCIWILKWTVLQLTFFWVPAPCGIISLFQDYRRIFYPCLHSNFIRFRWMLKWLGGAGVSIIYEGRVDFDLQEPWRGKQWRNFSVLASNDYFFILHYSVKILLFTLICEQADEEFVVLFVHGGCIHQCILLWVVEWQTVKAVISWLCVEQVARMFV